jgi:hypothetical protein
VDEHSGVENGEKDTNDDLRSTLSYSISYESIQSYCEDGRGILDWE